MTMTTTMTTTTISASQRKVGRLAEEYLTTLARNWVATSSTLMKHELPRDECQHCHEKFSSRRALFAHMRSHKHFTLRVQRSGFSVFNRKHALMECYFEERKAMELVSWILLGPMLSSAPQYWSTTEAAGNDDLTASLLPHPTILTYQLDTGESILLLLVARAVAAAASPDQGADQGMGLRAQCLRMLRLGLADRARRTRAFESTASWSERDRRDMWVGLGNLSTVEARVFASAINVAREARDEQVLELLIGVVDDGLRLQLATPCDVCFEERIFCCGEGGRLATVASCGHTCCSEYAAGWISTQVHELQRGVGEVLCFACPAPLTSGELARFAPLASERAERLTVEKALIGMEDFVWCPAGCSSGGFTTGSGVDDHCRSVTCQDCGFAFCAECHASVALHTRQLQHSCIWLSCGEAAQNSLTSAYIDKRTRACPKEDGGCGVYTERDGGCSHMTCKVCKFEWCWLCGGKYKGRYTTGSKCPC